MQMIKTLHKTGILFIIVFLSLSFSVSSQGLKFYSNNELIENRTSYNVFAHEIPKFHKELSINFEFSIINPSDFGYVFWINDASTNISYLLTFVYETNEISYLKFNLEGKENLFTIPLKISDLGSRKWHKFSVRFILEKKIIVINADNKSYEVSGLKFNNIIEPTLIFGKRGSAIDVPEFAIRNLIILGSKKDYHFKFNEDQGHDVHDSDGNLIGSVENPCWLITESYKWKLRYKAVLPFMVAINYDSLAQNIIILHKDSLTSFNFQTNTTVTKKYLNPMPVPIRLGTSFIDSKHNTLFVYEVNDINVNAVSISELNLNSLKWKKISKSQLPQQRHHHIGYFNSDNNEYLIFGGFGNKKYSNEFNSYSINTDKWSAINFSGETIPPRFFCGMVYIEKNNLLIFGGIGNLSGDQTLGKRYYYDCYKVNLDTKTIQKLWENNYSSNFVSTRNMVIAEGLNSFYTLCYTEYIPNTFIKLNKFVIKDGTRMILGDSIPLLSEGIETNANLYYNTGLKELYCVVQEVLHNGTNQVRIYSLSSPPVSKHDFCIEKTRLSKKMYLWLFLFFLVIMILYFIIKFRKGRLLKLKILNRQKQIVQNTTDNIQIHKNPLKNSIYLFGEFAAYDKTGKDISFLFSPKIKQLFLLILLNSIEDGTGVTSNQIHETIWADKPIEKAKNSKGVTLNQIRDILVDFAGIQLIFNKNKFKIEIQNPFYCDLINFKLIFTELQQQNFNNKELVDEVVQIVSRGPYLKYSDIEFLDEFKSIFENKLLNIIPYRLKKYFEIGDYSTVVQVAKILFYFDELNEIVFQYEILALVKLDLIEKAKKRYNAFILKYMNENNDDFPYTFHDLCLNTPLLNKNDN